MIILSLFLSPIVFGTAGCFLRPIVTHVVYRADRISYLTAQKMLCNSVHNISNVNICRFWPAIKYQNDHLLLENSFPIFNFRRIILLLLLPSSVFFSSSSLRIQFIMSARVWFWGLLFAVMSYEMHSRVRTILGLTTFQRWYRCRTITRQCMIVTSRKMKKLQGHMDHSLALLWWQR